MLHISVAEKLFENVNGASFVGIDTETKVTLKGGKKNPMQGRVTKRHYGASVMVFQNKKGSAYGRMVERRLEAEGKDPASFQLQPRAWGERIPETPFIEHKGKYYLEVIFLRPGKSVYYLDGKEIDKNEIQGLEEAVEGNQGGLDNKVIIRTYSLDSILNVRIDGKEYTAKLPGA